jgi:DNA-binding NtrC family response regulator
MNKILIIDDDFAVQTSLQLLLQQAGFQVKTCDSPAVARELIPTFKPVLVILDLNFSIETSGEEGMKALKMLRAEFPEVLIILLTGWGTIDLAVEG